MGREVRRVPENWQHPKDERTGHHKPLYGRSYKADAEEFMALANKDGLQAAVDYFGCAPDVNAYMPDWPDEQRTHLMMYEDTSEGTPISPAFKTPEELARWLADNGASAFGHSTATYEQWLAMIGQGFAVSLVVDSRGMRSGVEAASDRS